MSEGQSSNHLGLIVGIPVEKVKGWDTGRAVCPEWAFTLSNLVYPTGLSHTQMAVAGKRIDEARCEIIEKAMELGASYVFFLDDDVLVPINILLHLYPILVAEPNLIAVGGIYPPKRHPTEPMAYRKTSHGPCYDMKYGEVFDVESIATGALLVKVDLFKNLEKPWFKTVKESGQDGSTLYSRSMTDDIYFCYKAKKAGYDIKAHAGLLCSHVDVERHIQYTLNQYLPKPKEAAEVPSSEA